MERQSYFRDRGQALSVLYPMDKYMDKITEKPNKATALFFIFPMQRIYNSCALTIPAMALMGMRSCAMESL